MNPQLDASRMLSQVHVQIRTRLGADDRYQWFTQAQIAERWQVHPVTVRKRMMRLRRAGLGPTAEQCERRKLNAVRRLVLYRGDYVIFAKRQCDLG